MNANINIKKHWSDTTAARKILGKSQDANYVIFMFSKTKAEGSPWSNDDVKNFGGKHRQFFFDANISPKQPNQRGRFFYCFQMQSDIQY